MSLRNWMFVLLAVAAIGWWFSPVSPRDAYVPAAVDASAQRCVLPPRVGALDPPLQSQVPRDMGPIRLRAGTLTPVAGFSVDARVLSREEYRVGRESALSPVDLALGWGRMRDDDVLGQLEIHQGARFYRYRWNRSLVGVTPQDIARSSANMHMIPSDAAAAEALKRVRAGDRVRIDGWLVNADAPDGWHWRTSTTRDDTGAGACEVVYVCSVMRL